MELLKLPQRRFFVINSHLETPLAYSFKKSLLYDSHNIIELKRLLAKHNQGNHSLPRFRHRNRMQDYTFMTPLALYHLAFSRFPFSKTVGSQCSYEAQKVTLTALTSFATWKQ